jgi:hypothetical protein
MQESCVSFCSFIKSVLWVLDLYICHFSVGAQKVKNTCVQFREVCQLKSREGLVPSIICIYCYVFFHYFIVI